MKKLLGLTALSTILCTSLVFACGPNDSDDSSACGTIAKACKSAGFTRGGDKKFWHDCMHPLLIGQSVKDVTIDPGQVKACRDKKIGDLQDELKELQNVK